MKKFKISNDGLSLLEVIIALAIASLVALGLVKATGSAVKNSRFSTDQSQVTALAQEKIAKIVDYKNKNAKDFWSRINPAGSPAIVNAAQVGGPTDNISLIDTCFITKVNKNTDWSGPAPADLNAEMAIITVDVFWGNKTNNPHPPCISGSTDFSHSLHFETNVTN